MAKLSKIDTTSIPQTITAPWIKRFFKDYFGIPVRVQNASRSGWVSVRISPDRDSKDLVYQHHFPEGLGNRCLRLVYPDSEKLCSQNWAGNIQQHSLAMQGSEIRQLFQDTIAESTIPIT